MLIHIPRASWVCFTKSLGSKCKLKKKKSDPTVLKTGIEMTKRLSCEGSNLILFRGTHVSDVTSQTGTFLIVCIMVFWNFLLYLSVCITFFSLVNFSGFLAVPFQHKALLLSVNASRNIFVRFCRDSPRWLRLTFVKFITELNANEIN